MNNDGPESLRFEHDELHDQLEKATRAGGATGDAARHVLEVVGPHVQLEEAFAIPPLTLLPALASGVVPDDVAEILEKSARLKEELPGMLADHQRIVAALKRLMQAAMEEKQAGFADFARKLILHAQMEEEVLYPAAIVVGDYVRLLREKG
ncbi:MAG TPA: hemerythrin domain-containing protein [Thermoanaerobaculia bacterium]|nr:hemerythrin domain-containing protein [Thermoanaerobaculia bacterium]